MKKSLYLFLLFALALFNTGCRHTVAYPTVLSEADSLCMTAPTEAVALLDSIAPQMQQSSDAVRHYYDLLTVKARDKAFLPHTSDSLILDVLHYYEANNDRVNLPEAYYYAGRVTSDMGDAPQALSYFQSVLDVIKSFDSNECKKAINLCAITNAQMGYILRKQHLCAEALSCFRESYRCDSLLRDTVGMVYDIEDMGQVNRLCENYQAALDCFRDAERLALAINDSSIFAAVFYQEIFVQIYLGHYSDALKKYKETQVKISQADLPIIFSLRAILYSKNDLKDSAAYYFNKVEQIGTLSQKMQSNIWFANDAIEKNDSKKAFELLKRQIILSDSIAAQKETETIGLINSLYNYQLFERENNELRTKHKTYQAYSIIASLIAVILILLIIFVLYILHRTRMSDQAQRKRIQYFYEQQQQYNENRLLENKKRIENLQHLIEQAESNRLQTELDRLMLQTTQAELDISKKQSFYADWLCSDICLKVNENVKNSKPLNEEDWEEIEKQIQALDPNFLMRLHSIYDFSTVEWRVSLLIKLKLQPTKISILICRKDSTISSIRQRLFYKVTRKKGSASDWDDFILNI